MIFSVELILLWGFAIIGVAMSSRWVVVKMISMTSRGKAAQEEQYRLEDEVLKDQLARAEKDNEWLDQQLNAEIDKALYEPQMNKIDELTSVITRR